MEQSRAEQQFKRRMPVVGRIAIYSRAVWWHERPGGDLPVLRWWHPVSWMLAAIAVVALVPVCMMTDCKASDYVRECVECFNPHG